MKDNTREYSRILENDRRNRKEKIMVLKRLRTVVKRILFVSMFGFGSLTMRPKVSFAREPLPIVKIVNEHPEVDPEVEVFEFDCFVSPGKIGKAIVNFKPRSLDEQLIYEKQQFELQKQEQEQEDSRRYNLLRILEPQKRFDEENRMNVVKHSLNGKECRFFIREELPVDSILRKDHVVKGKVVKGMTHRIRPPYFEAVDNQLAQTNQKLIEEKKQLLFENKVLQEQLSQSKK